MITALLARCIVKFRGWLLAAAGFLAAAAAIYFKGRAEGRAAEQARQQRQAAKDIQAAREIEDDVDGLGHADLDRRLERWLRDDD